MGRAARGPRGFPAERAGRALLATAFASLVAYGIRLLAMPLEQRVERIPDDGFYYLSLGRQFAALGRWTVDGGRTVTSGFHPAWAWLLAGLQAVTGAGRDAYLTTALVLCAGLSWAALVLPLAWPLRGPRWPLLLALAAVVASPLVAVDSASLTEWPLVVLCSGFYVWALVREGERGTAWPVFAAGFAGSLARSEFGILPFAMLAARVLLGRRAAGGPGWRPCLAGLAGAAAGAAAGLLHNLAFTGELLQSSARMKLHWGAVMGTNDPLMPLSLLMRLATGIEVNSAGRFLAVLAVGCVLLAVPAVRVVRRLSRREPEGTEAVLLAGSLLALAGCVVVYARGLVPQVWYTSLMVVPLVLVWRGLLRSLDSPRARAAALVVCAVPVLAGAVGVHCAPGARARPVALWPFQARLLDAGRWVAGRAWDGPVGSWNAGVIGYVSDGRVVNLDGLVNNEVVPWILAGRFEGYLVAKRIRYLVDFGLMTEPWRARCGGFDGVRLDRSVVRTTVVSRETRPGAQAFGPAVLCRELDMSRLMK